MKNKTKFIEQLVEYIKHFTTLSTGSILLLATFLEKLFANPKWKFLAAISFGGFIISVVASVVAYTYLLDEYPETEEKSEDPLGVVVSLLFTWLGFLLGITSLTILSIRNLF